MSINPLSQKFTEKDQAAPFNQIKVEHYMPALEDAIKEAKTNLDKIKAENADEQKCISAVFEAVLTPLWQIAENAGYDGSEIVDMQLKADTNIGFDAKNGKWVNLYEAGIVDPTKVTRSAILNASSIAALFLTTEAAVASVPEKKTIPSLAEPDIY